MVLCPSVSNKGVLCTHPEGHPGPHKGHGDTGRAVVWGFRASARPMYPKQNVRPQQVIPFHEEASSTQCTATYTENNVSFRCVRPNGHMGPLHRSERLQWTVTKENA